MSRQQIADRLGATPTLADPKKMAAKSESIAAHLSPAQFLSVASNHVEAQTNVSHELSPRIAMALALSDGKPREDYLKQVVGKEDMDRHVATLRFIESLMNESDRATLHQEVCMALGTVH